VRALTFVITLDGPTLLRWALGALFVAAAVSKLANPTVFLGDILAYRLPLPEALLRLTAVVLPWLELLCGLLVLAGAWRDAALSVMLALCVVFLAATGQAWARDLHIACGCLNLRAFGIEDNTPLLRLLESTPVAFGRNVLMAVGAGYLWWRAIKMPEAVDKAPQ